jgi:hypothetical protein
VTSYGLNVQGLIPGRGGIFIFTTTSKPVLRLTVVDISGLFPGVKSPERETDHSPPSSAKVKNVCSFTSIPPTPSCPGT